MGRLKGSKNKNSNSRIISSSLPTQERIRFFANLIIERIKKDLREGQPLLNKLQPR